MNTVYLALSTQVAEGTIYRRHTVNTVICYLFYISSSYAYKFIYKKSLTQTSQILTLTNLKETVDYFDTGRSSKKVSGLLTVTLYKLSIYSFVHNQLIRTLFETHILYGKNRFQVIPWWQFYFWSNMLLGPLILGSASFA